MDTGARTECRSVGAGDAAGVIPNLDTVAIVIPAFQPDARLVQLISSLRSCGAGPIVVVDDGSSPDRESIFEALCDVTDCVVCHHPRNRGKGRTLKTGFAYVLCSLPHVRGVVTADADGQHLATDIVEVARQFTETPEGVLLGARSFTGNVPRRSAWGNAVSRQVFRWLIGARLTDTQTGLRALPFATLPRLMTLPGEGYEYETAMLAQLCRDGSVLREVQISTVYLDGNRSSHFKPLRDSVRIYAALLRASLRSRHRPSASKQRASAHLHTA